MSGRRSRLDDLDVRGSRNQGRDLDDLGSRTGRGRIDASVGSTGRRGGNKVFNKAFLIWSIIFGVLACIPTFFLYDAIKKDWYGPLAIAVTVGTFYVVYVILVVLYCSIQGTYTHQNGGSNMFVPVLISIAGIFMASFVFEFIYELGGKYEMSEPSSYVFVIDDSGSMDGSDPKFQRYDAISQILEGKEESFPYAVYSFSNEIICLREMAPRGTTVETFSMPESQGGGTPIKGALTEVLEDFKSGKISDTDSPKVLLLSDGYAGDIGIFSSVKSLLKEYVENGISISTVGLGSSVDESLMNKIAKGTGGIYMNVSEASNLAEVMNEAIEASSARDLLSLRVVPKADFLYFIERVLFMGLIGAAIGIMMIFAAGLQKDSDLVMVSSIIKGFSASLILELFINTFGSSERMMQLIYFVIISAIFSTLIVREKTRGRGYGTYGENRQGSDSRNGDIANRFKEEQSKKKGNQPVGRFDL